jgi:hypothetical protein
LKQQWNEALPALMDENWELVEIHSAPHFDIVNALEKKPQNKRDTRTDSLFKIIARRECAWERGGDFEPE